jgi:hypothetical protein
MTKLRLALFLVIIASSAFNLKAQTAAMVATIPVFQPLDNNGVPVPGGTICSYLAGTGTLTDTFTTSVGNISNTNPVILDSSGRANVWLKVATKLVLSKPGTGCPSTGAQIWSIDGISVITSNPVFNSVTSATTFNSRADIAGGTAFQTSGGTMTISGTGNGAFQEMAANHYSFVGFASAPTPPGAGFAFMYYDTVLSGLRYNLGGAGWTNLLSGVAGSVNELQYNGGGAAFASSPKLTWNNTTGNLSACIAVAGICTVTSGFNGQAFSSTATGTNPAFVTGGGTATITGAGNIAAQNVTVHSVFNSQADTFGGNAFQTSGGTVVITGVGDGAFQSLSVTTNYTAAGQTGITSNTCSHFTGGICDTP